ncbi:unnamed protein product [Camellia sinensis]
MIANGIEDEDKWLTEGIARIQHNCFLYASRTAFDELRRLEIFFKEEDKHGCAVSDLYELVQHAGNILPRLATQILESRICELEIAVSSVKSARSVSPRLQQKKLERQPNKQQPESSSPGGKCRPKSTNLQQIDDQSSEISCETRNSSYLEDDISMRSNGNIVSDSGIDTEVTSLERCAETNGSQSPSMKAAKYSVSGVDCKSKGQNKTTQGQIKLKEAALETLANSFLEKEKDLEDKIEELERRLEELSQNSASFYEYQFQKIQIWSITLGSSGKRQSYLSTISTRLVLQRLNLLAKICASHGVYEEFVSRSSSINAEYEAKACDTQAAVKVDQHTSTTPKLKIKAVLSLASIEEMRTPAVGDLMENFTGPNLGCTESKIQQHQQGLCLGASPNNRTLVAMEPEKHVFHLVTDKLNFGAMNMWFLLNPPGKATIHVENVDEFKWLNSSYCPVLRQLESSAMKEYYFKADHSTAGSSNLKYRNPKYLSMLNHLRFYLPQVYPKLDKILFLDDDIVVQKDLTGLWSVDLRGKVNGAVETCGESFHHFDKYLNFSNPHIARNFDPNACGWAYGMNFFDLEEWKKKDITGIYHKWQNMKQSNANIDNRNQLKTKHRDNMIKIQAEHCSRPGVVPITPEELSVKVLKPRSGYVKGLGLRRSFSVRTTSASTDSDYVRRLEMEIQEQKEQIQSQKEEIQSQKEEIQSQSGNYSIET